jgi:DNA primase
VSDIPLSPEDSQAAGLKRTDKPARTEVTAACGDSVADGGEVDEHTALDFAHLKRQLSMERVLDHLGLLAKLRGSGAQRRCTCPIHRGDARGKTFSVNLSENVFQCFEAKCGKKGDVIDLWSSVKGLSLREAALELVRTFHVEPSPRQGTEKRNG